MTTNSKISARILALVAAGEPLEDAVDHVLGAGAFAKMASELYDGLRAPNWASPSAKAV